MVGCECCNTPVTDALLYVRFTNLIEGQSTPECFEECEAINDVCFELPQVGQCAWAALITQNVTCYPFSILVVELHCDGVKSWFTARWLQTTSRTANFKSDDFGPTVDCVSCLQTPYSLAPQGFLTSGCNHAFGTLDISFHPMEACCQYCPEQYQVQLAGFSAHQPAQGCDDATCQLLNGIYLVDFVASGVTVPQTSFGITDACKYSTNEISVRCAGIFSPGFCTLDVYIKPFDNCTTYVAIILTFDETTAFLCNEGDRQLQGWEGFVAQGCKELDSLISTLLLDTDALCIFDNTTATIEAVPD